MGFLSAEAAGRLVMIKPGHMILASLTCWDETMARELGVKVCAYERYGFETS